MIPLRGAYRVSPAVCALVLSACTIATRVVAPVARVSPEDNPVRTSKATTYVDLGDGELRVGVIPLNSFETMMLVGPLLMPIIPVSFKRAPSILPGGTLIELRFSTASTTYSIIPSAIQLQLPDGRRIQPNGFLGPGHWLKFSEPMIGGHPGMPDGAYCRPPGDWTPMSNPDTPPTDRFQKGTGAIAIPPNVRGTGSCLLVIFPEPVDLGQRPSLQVSGLAKNGKDLPMPLFRFERGSFWSFASAP